MNRDRENLLRLSDHLRANRGSHPFKRSTRIHPHLIVQFLIIVVAKLSLIASRGAPFPSVILRPVVSYIVSVQVSAGDPIFPHRTATTADVRPSRIIGRGAISYCERGAITSIVQRSRASSFATSRRESPSILHFSFLFIPSCARDVAEISTRAYIYDRAGVGERGNTTA